MKNDCLRKCLIEVDLDKFYTAFINNGITTCDLLTKISFDQFSNLGIINAEDKLKLIELIKIIKSIQSDLIVEYENTKLSKLKTETESETISIEVKSISTINNDYTDNSVRQNVDDFENVKLEKISCNDVIESDKKLLHYSSTESDCEFVSQSESDLNHVPESHPSSENSKNNLVNHDINDKIEKLSKPGYGMALNSITNNTNQITKSNRIKSLKIENKIKNNTCYIKSNTRGQYIPDIGIKSVQSKSIISKYSSPIGQLSNKSNLTNSKLKPVELVMDKNVEGIFNSNEIQLSSTPLKPFKVALNSSHNTNDLQNQTNSLQLAKVHEGIKNISAKDTLQNSYKTQPAINRLRTSNNSRLNIDCKQSNIKSNLLEMTEDMMQLEVVSGHTPLFNNSKRNLSNQLLEISNKDKNNSNGIDKDALELNESNKYSMEFPIRRRNTYDKTTDQSMHSKSFDIIQDNALNCSQNIAQDIFLQTKSNIDEARRNVHQAMSSNNSLSHNINHIMDSSNKLSIQPLNMHGNYDDVQSNKSVTTDDIHLDTSGYFKPIKFSPITTVTQLTSEDQSSIEHSNDQRPKFHPNCTSTENISEEVKDLDICCNNININSNKFTPENIDYISYPSSAFSSNREYHMNNLSNMNCNIDTNEYYEKNNDSHNHRNSCVACLEVAHEQQLSDVTNLSSLEMQALILYKQKRISTKEYLEKIKPMLEKKMNCINNLLSTCNHFQL